jgi:iojap-like ribosome-associated protein
LESRDLLKIAYKAIEDKKGENIKMIDISQISSIADYFIITEGGNINQIQAIADEVEEQLEKAGASPKHIEGYRNASWILLDYTDIVVHIFAKEDRKFYDLERIWADGIFLEKI